MKKELLGSFFVLAAGTLWGFMGVFVRSLAASGFSPLQIIAVRVAVAALMMCVMGLIVDRSAFKIKLKDIWCFVGTGIISLSFFGYCYFTCIEMTSMSVAAILLYTAPIMVMLMSLVLFKEKITLQKAICLAIAFVGCIFVSGILGSAHSVPVPALIFGLLSGLFYALYSIFGRFAINRGYSSLTITLYTFIFACVALFAISDVGGIVKLVSSDTSVILPSVGMGVITGFAPYLLYTAGLERLESGKASIMASVEPAVATVCGMVFFNEFPDLFGWIGIVLVLGAIVLLNIKMKRE